MQYIVHNLKVDIDGNGSVLPTLAAKKIGCGVDHIRELVIIRRSLDARPAHLGWVYSVVVDLKSKGSYLYKRRHRRQSADVKPFTPPEPMSFTPGDRDCGGGPVIVGSGPAGMFAALMLAEQGYRPTVIERGPDAETRRQKIAEFLESRSFDGEGNFIFGEGGAGTYSDGKLYSRIGDDLSGWVLDKLVEFGADPDIAIDSRPHIGSDRLGYICQRIREHIESRGGRYLFDTRVDDIEISDGSVRSLVLSSGERLAVSCVILAIGHSARDSFEALQAAGIAMQPKAFQMGLRVEHPQKFIDEAQLGEFANRRQLTPADYNLVAKSVVAADDDTQRAGDVYSFCMCPGGAVLPAHHEAGTICSNGGSNSQRDSGFANAALVMAVTPDRYGADDGDTLAGMKFQREIEAKCFKAAGGDYTMAAQRVEDFLAGKPSASLPEVSSLTAAASVDFNELLPEFICKSLAAALADFDEKMPGFASGDAVLMGPETRASCPVRILRDRQSRLAEGLDNLYPAGEGAGYAGGIMSSAVDGIKSAIEVIQSYARPPKPSK